MGLAAGDYVMKVVAVLKDGSTVGVKTSSLTVTAHDRTFAWVGGTASGAYKELSPVKQVA